MLLIEVVTLGETLLVSVNETFSCTVFNAFLLPVHNKNQMHIEEHQVETVRREIGGNI